MDDNSSSTGNNSEKPQPGINQAASGFFRGGQQAAAGNGNYQYQDNREQNVTINIGIDSYSRLKDKDLKPLSFWGKISNYFTVFCFLLFTFIFWAIFGLFTTFPFPLEQVQVLISSCFSGNLFSKINELQKKWQRKASTADSAEELNNLDFQARLYLKVLQSLGSKTPESCERLAQTIETLKLKKQKIEADLQSLQGSRYSNVFRVQDQFETILATKGERDLAHIDKFLSQMAFFMKNQEPSNDILHTLKQKVSEEIECSIENISPANLGVLYKIRFLFQELSDKDISRLDAPELDEFTKKTIKDLRVRTRELEESLKALESKNKSDQQELQNYLNRLTNLQNELDIKEQGYQLQRNAFLEEINELTRDIRQRGMEIERLRNELEKYSEIKALNGEYIGNLSEPSRKYHFSRRCKYWKSLAGNYVLKIDLSQEIVSSSTPEIFRRNGMNECNDCLKY
ncbi:MULTISPECIES: hypothetical protein [Cyanophyceae]|uniref:hypothetical protein n=1 Tax=Cyanophyceae TaxID=3028117 RepID=UPI001686BE85|nr:MULTISPECIES: hypothetical protein [Cyanophyceae]MBD1918928.1 hypothetical protein [Phormidium sp. FACHB-77]MBD2033230.1 hypothetical protein [Phormidium sp. FACHB-322]MBD2053837.1 hypothetical protein [Leptolyngbya sp. FACHB-60]